MHLCKYISRRVILQIFLILVDKEVGIRNIENYIELW